MNREAVLSAARRAHEWGRLVAGLRVAIIVVPVAVIAALATREFERCACLGAVLLVLTVGLRWRDRRGAQAVEAGLAAGLVPLLAALLLRACVADCAPMGLPLCLGSGVIAGAWLGWRVAAVRGELTTALLAACVAALTASLSCVAFGAGGVLGVTTALAASSAAIVTLRQPRRIP